MTDLSNNIDYPKGAETNKFQPDLILQTVGHVFQVEWKSSSSSAMITHAIQYLKTTSENRVPIVAVPYMGPTGKKLCKEAQVNWMDLSGNASIQVHKQPGLFVDITGQQNKFIKRGRPASVFAPKSSRVVRWLLLNPNKPFTNKRLVHETGADAGHISRILQHLEKEGYISPKEKGEQRLLSPELLLADWRAEYDFFKQNDVIRGHIPARNNTDLMLVIEEALATEVKPQSPFQYSTSNAADAELPKYAYTGLAAAWLYTEYVTHRLVAVYLRNFPSEQLLRSMQFREEPRGANLWLAIPKDNGVFMGVENVNGIPCVSRIQTYLDLKDQPERADEAAEELRRHMNFTV